VCGYHVENKKKSSKCGKKKKEKEKAQTISRERGNA
jgi:hypothetical protein